MTTSPTDHRAALNISEFAAVYGVHRDTARREIKEGRLIARKLGRRTLILREDAEAWARALPVAGAGEAA